MNKYIQTYFKNTSFLIFCFLYIQTNAQSNVGNIYVEKDKLIIKFDKRDIEEFQNMLHFFGLNEDSIFNHHSIGKLKNEGWYIYKLKKNYCKIARPVSQGMDDIYWGSQPIFLWGNFMNPEIPGYPKPVNFGINHFVSNPSVFKNEKNEAVFISKNFKEAQTVFLSGNFNNWSTSNTPMTKSENGWIAILPLEPGKYYYKFIVDGVWYFDENNLQKAEDGYEDFNSTYFQTNYAFELKNDSQFNEVYIAGSFNLWDEKAIALTLQNNVWKIDIYLNEGTHQYKFIADNVWMLDPLCKSARPDGNGNFNSSVSIGTPQAFFLSGYLNANTVTLAGSFNQWNHAELEMQKTNIGWELKYTLAPGNYEYQFIVDGLGIRDPNNPIKVGDSLSGNSFICVFANYTFVCDSFVTAEKIYVTGSFNQWAEPGYPMKFENGKWTLDLFLPVGKYVYKYIVDDIWHLDPTNSMVEENEYGTGNSILWIEGNQQFYRK